MRTIALAASIAVITAGGVAGTIVGGAGAKIALDRTALAAPQHAATVAMTRPPRDETAPDPRMDSQADAQTDSQTEIQNATPTVRLRLGHEAPAAPDAMPVPMHLTPAVPEQASTAPATTHANLQPATTPRVLTTAAPATPAAQAPVQHPHRLVTRAPGPVRTAPTARDQALAIQPATPAVVAPPARTPAAHPAATPRTATRHAPAQALELPATTPTLGTGDATHQTTMSQRAAAPTTEPTPSPPAPTPAEQASSPPPAMEQPSALLANP